MKQDTFLRNSGAACFAMAALLTSACSQAPESATTAKKTDHIWSDQVDTLHQAKEVADYASELQTLQNTKLQQRHGVDR